ncbi:MAG: hypothetical protein EA401_04915 [Planctomycetota bacterium]|nr:MAG: hypothetical protein EA401_04915 [Planctomycetota bacterium]
MHTIYESSLSDAKAILKQLKAHNIPFSVSEDDGPGMGGFGGNPLAIHVDNENAETLKAITVEVKKKRHQINARTVRGLLVLACGTNISLLCLWLYVQNQESRSVDGFPFLAGFTNTLLIFCILLFMKGRDD